MSTRSSATSKSIRSHLLMVGLAAISFIATSGVFATSAEAGSSFSRVDCGAPPPSNVVLVPVNQNAFCTDFVSNVGGPTPSGNISFSDSLGTGQFSPSICTLREEKQGAASCTVAFSSAVVGQRTITAKFPGDGSNSPSEAATGAKVFIPNSTRFAAPGGTGPEPCTDKAHPCSLFVAASTRAPGAGVAPGQEVVLAPGTYTKADLGPFAELTLESGITLRGEPGAARPLLSIESAVFGRNEKISHLEIETKGPTAIDTAESVVDEIVAKSSGSSGTTCIVESGVLRDSACISSGAGAAAAGTGFFTERAETIQARFRNVTAISTGANSFGVRFSIESLGQTPGQVNADLGSVIAKGTKADVVAQAGSFPGEPPGIVHVALDHSDYASIEPKDPTANLSVTAPGDAGHNNITAAPLLAADNIHETFSSPTIDKGVLDGTFGGSVDVDGEPRKQAAAPDIGADEIQPPNSTETKLTCQAASVFTGGSTTCAATVTDKADGAAARSFVGDTVSFNDATQVGAFVAPATCTLATVDDTHASCQTEVELKPTTVASHELEAIFPVDGKGHLGSIGKLAMPVKPLPNSTEAKLTCQAPSVFSGGATTCSATVTDKADHQPLATLAGGTVTFKDNTEGKAFPAPATCTLATISSSQASCQTEVEFKPTTVAEHALEASYAGDGDKHAPSAGTLSYKVKPKPNKTETELTCKATSLISGEATKCNVLITDTADQQAPSSLAGATVTFKDNTESGAFSPSATCVLVAKGAVQATCQEEVSFKPTTPASHNLEASYPGDGDKHAPSVGILSFKVKSKANTTETALTCKEAPVISGEATKCNVTVTDTADNNPASSLAGTTVSFKDNTESGAFPGPATCTLVTKNSLQASCEKEVEFKPHTVAEHNLEASYPGDGEKHAPSSGALGIKVKPKPNKTETELTCKVAVLISGEATKCNVTVTDTADNNPASSLAGTTVSFKDNTESGAFPGPATCTLVTKNSLQASCEKEVEFKPHTVAEHNLEASYPGDGEKHAASLDTLTFEVRAQLQPNNTKTELSCKTLSLVKGEATKCNATVTDKADNGPAAPLAGQIVTFKDNLEPAAFPPPASCTLKTINATQASCEIEVDLKPETVGNHPLEATYPNDGGKHFGSVSTPVTVQVRPQPNSTETKLTCKASPVIKGETTQCTAELIDKADHTAASSFGGDTVTFKDETEEIALNPKTCTLAVLTTTTATCQTEIAFKPETIGNHALKATFGPDGTHAGSFAEKTIQVKAPPNNTKTRLECKATSLITGESTHCTAEVTDQGDNGAPTPPTGTVTFKDSTQAGTFSPASCQLQTSGANVAKCQAEVEFKPTTIANHQLEASFTAATDPAHLASVGTAEFLVKVQPNDTETKLECKGASVVTGGSTTCNAVVTDKANHNPASSLAGGVVTFSDNTENGAFVAPSACTLKQVATTQAECQTEVEFKPTAVGGHALEAVYPGDGGAHARSVKTITFQVNPQANDTETELSCKAASLFSGEATTCTATVTDIANHNQASSPAGTTVTFSDTTEAGSFAAPATCLLVAKGATRATCQAEVDFKPTTVAEHALQASYPGDGENHAASVGALGIEVKVVQEQPHATATSLVCDPTALVLGTGVSQCTATVEDTAAGATHPSGEVKLEVLSGEGTLAAKSCVLPENGQAKVSCQVIAFTPAKAGSHELKATYQGDSKHAQSSGTAKLTVSNATQPPPPPPPTPTPSAPNTSIGRKPAKRTSSATATFTFGSDQAGGSFLCKLDRKAAKACRSPFKAKVGPGAHTLTVTAINAQGLADPTPASYRWTVAPAKKRKR